MSSLDAHIYKYFLSKGYKEAAAALKKADASVC
jgi:hypothetical protein